MRAQLAQMVETFKSTQEEDEDKRRMVSDIVPLYKLLR